MKRSASLCGMLALILTLFAGAATAQETRGSIEGVVKDSSGAVLPGATVEARDAQSGTVASAVSDTAGKYRFPSLTPGRYVVAANMSGFKKAQVENVDLLLGQVLQVNFSLEVGAITEDVQVTAESPIIDVKQNAAGAIVKREIIDLIPKARDFTDLSKSAPGTNNEGRGGGIMVDGASGSENRFVVDGLDTTSLRTGTSSTQVVSDFVEQVQVKSSGYNAEFRATTGGVISAITRSGSNRFSGEIGTYFSDDDWRGDIRKSIRLNPTNQTLPAQYTTTARDPRTVIEPVFTLGGPIVRDKMWFFAGYVPQFSDRSRTVTFTQNRAAGPQTFEAKTEDHNITYNVSAQVTQSFRMKFSGAHQPQTGGLGLPALEPDTIDGVPVPAADFRTSTANPANFPSVLYNKAFNNSFRSINDWVVSPNLFVNVTGGYLKYGNHDETLTSFNTNTRRTFSGSNTCSPTAQPNTPACPFPELIPTNLQQPNGYADGIVNSRAVRDDYSRFGISSDLTYFANWRGTHSLKGGFQYERLANDVLTGQQAPNIALNWNASRTTIDVPPRIVRGAYGYYEVRRSYTEGQIHSNNYGIFLQDMWTVNNKLTLNLGLRADQEDVPSYRPENPGIHFGFGEKIAPRLGFAYDMKGDGRWKSYGSWGMFYDISKLEMPRGSFGADRWISYYWTLDTSNWPSIDCDGQQGNCPGTFIEQVDFRHVSNGVGSEQLVDSDLQPIRAQEFTLGMEHQLAQTMSLSVRYAHKWLDRTIEDVGINVPGVGEVFYISNPGEGLTENLLRDKAGCTTCPNQPKPKRTYDGIELRLMKRLSNNWYANVSYTFSRLYGNYSGLASSDENGRTSPSVNRFFDGQYMSFDQTGQPVFGDLGTDRPHQFELQAAYQFKWGTQVGSYYLLGSGLPQQHQATMFGVPVLFKGRASMGRTPTLSQLDLNILQDVKLYGRTRATFELNILNVFDQDIVTTLSNTPYRDTIPVASPAAFFAGFDADAIAAATPSVRKDPRFGQASGFQGERTIRVAAKIRF